MNTNRLCPRLGDLVRHTHSDGGSTIGLVVETYGIKLYIREIGNDVPGQDLFVARNKVEVISAAPRKKVFQKKY